MSGTLNRHNQCSFHSSSYESDIQFNYETIYSVNAVNAIH